MKDPVDLADRVLAEGADLRGEEREGSGVVLRGNQSTARLCASRLRSPSAALDARRPHPRPEPVAD